MKIDNKNNIWSVKYLGKSKKLSFDQSMFFQPKKLVFASLHDLKKYDTAFLNIPFIKFQEYFQKTPSVYIGPSQPFPQMLWSWYEVSLGIQNGRNLIFSLQNNYESYPKSMMNFAKHVFFEFFGCINSLRFHNFIDNEELIKVLGKEILADSKALEIFDDLSNRAYMGFLDDLAALWVSQFLNGSLNSDLLVFKIFLAEHYAKNGEWAKLNEHSFDFVFDLGVLIGSSILWERAKGIYQNFINHVSVLNDASMALIKKMIKAQQADICKLFERLCPEKTKSRMVIETIILNAKKNINEVNLESKELIEALEDLKNCQ